MKEGKSSKGNVRIAQVGYAVSSQFKILDDGVVTGFYYSLLIVTVYLMKLPVPLQNTEEASTSTAMSKPKTDKKPLRNSGM